MSPRTCFLNSRSIVNIEEVKDAGLNYVDLGMALGIFHDRRI